MNPDEKVIDSAQQYGAELASPRIVSGFAARALPVGSVLVRAEDGRPFLTGARRSFADGAS